MPAVISFYDDIDLQGYQVLNLRAHQITNTTDTSLWADGQLGYVTNSGDKHFGFRDTQAGAFIKLPRLDYAETLGAVWTFSPPSAGAPFILAANAYDQKVLRLNADLVDGYHASTAADAGTLAARDGNGRLKAADPSASDDLVSLGYMQSYISGVRDPKEAARVSTTANLSATRSSNVLTASANASINTAGIDGITTLAVNDRVLVKNQTTAADNGIYIITNLGSGSTPWVMQRAADADSSPEVLHGLQVFVTSGTVWGGSGWILATADPITLNTTALSFIQVSGGAALVAGNGIVTSGNTIHFAQSASYTAGDLFYASGASAVATLAIGANGKWLKVVSGAPSWQTLTASDVGGAAALTKTDDTNVTLTLGGNPSTALLAAASLTLGWTGSLAVGRGGTGLTGYTAGDLVYAPATNTLAGLGIGSNGKWLKVVSGAPSWQTLTAADVGSGAALTKTDDTNVTLTLGGSPTTALLAATSLTLGWTGSLATGRGGTGITTYTTGDLLYSSAVNTLSKLAGNTTTTKKFLTQTGDGTNSAAPAWGTVSASDIGSGAALTKVDDTNVTLTLGGSPTIALLAATSLTLGWSGSLATGRGGTGITTYTLGDLLYSSAANTLAKLGGNTTTTKKYLTQTGDGTNSGAPAWNALTAADIGSPAALTKTDDTNVTLTLGGSPTVALLAATSLTLGWSGQLSLARGGTNASLTAANGGLVYSTASALAITSALNGIVQGNGASAPTAITGTAGRHVKWASSAPYLADSILGESGQVLTINGGNSTLQSGTGALTLATGSNGDLLLSPNGTGRIFIGGSTSTARAALCGSYGVQQNTVASNDFWESMWNAYYDWSGTPTYRFFRANGQGALSFRMQYNTGFVWQAVAGPSTADAAISSWTTIASLSNAGVFSAASLNVSGLTASKLVFTDSSKNLTTTGTAAVAQGGTGLTSYVAGDLVYASATNTLSSLAIGSNGKWLKVVSGAPSWQTLTAADVGSGAALTKTDDTNVTLTLGGSPSAALLAAASLTLGWTGSLATGRGGTGLTSYTAGDLLYSSATNTLARRAIGTAGYFLKVVGGVPDWSNDLVAGSTIGGLGICRSYTTTITGNGTDTVFPVPHGLGTDTTNVTVWVHATNTAALVQIRCKAGSLTSAIEVVFGSAPANGVVFRVIVCA